MLCGRSALRSLALGAGTLAVLSACASGPEAAAPPANPSAARVEVDAPDGADIHVDGVTVGRAPLPGPVEMEGGSHHVAVTLDGHIPHERTVVVARRQKQKIEIELDETPQRKGAWAAIGIGAASVTAGVVLGVLSVVEHRKAADLEDGFNDDVDEEDQAAYDEAIEARDTYRLGSAITAGAGLAIFVTGALLFGFDSPDVPKPPGKPRVGVTPMIGPDAVGIAAGASF